MIYCNVNQFIAKKLLKIRNINNINQVEREFKVLAYYSWNGINTEQKTILRKGSSTPSLYKRSKNQNQRKSKINHNRLNIYVRKRSRDGPGRGRSNN